MALKLRIVAGFTAQVAAFGASLTGKCFIYSTFQYISGTFHNLKNAIIVRTQHRRLSRGGVLGASLER